MADEEQNEQTENEQPEENEQAAEETVSAPERPAPGAPRCGRFERHGQDNRRPGRCREGAQEVPEGRPPLDQVPRPRREEPGEGRRRRPDRRDAPALEDEELASRRDRGGSAVMTATAPSRESRTRQGAAKPTGVRPGYAVASVASRYEHSLRPCQSGFSL